MADDLLNNADKGWKERVADCANKLNKAKYIHEKNKESTWRKL